jgi:hypothetical protein
VPLLDEKEIKCMIMKKKKRYLLSKYTSDDIKEEKVKAKEMLSI